MENCGLNEKIEKTIELGNEIDELRDMIYAVDMSKCSFKDKRKAIKVIIPIEDYNSNIFHEKAKLRVSKETLRDVLYGIIGKKQEEIEGLFKQENEKTTRHRKTPKVEEVKEESMPIDIDVHISQAEIEKISSGIKQVCYTNINTRSDDKVSKIVNDNNWKDKSGNYKETKLNGANCLGRKVNVSFWNYPSKKADIKREIICEARLSIENGSGLYGTDPNKKYYVYNIIKVLKK